MVDLAKEVGSELMGAGVGLTTFIILTVGGDPTAFDLVYYVTKIVDLAFSGAAAVTSYIVVHIAKKMLTSPKDNWLKRAVRNMTEMLKSK
jgi:hypothetical protein